VGGEKEGRERRKAIPWEVGERKSKGQIRGGGEEKRKKTASIS